jgi:hypothetical protein
MMFNCVMAVGPLPDGKAASAVAEAVKYNAIRVTEKGIEAFG